MTTQRPQNMFERIAAHFAQSRERNQSITQARSLFERAQGRRDPRDARALRAQALTALSVVR
jgi:hypothetical protein